MWVIKQKLQVIGIIEIYCFNKIEILGKKTRLWLVLSRNPSTVNYFWIYQTVCQKRRKYGNVKQKIQDIIEM